MRKRETKQSYLYSAYGLKIKSDIQLSELMPSQTGEDIRIELKNLSDSFLNEELINTKTYKRVGCTVKISADKTLCDWNGLGKFLIRNGSQILIDPENGIKDTDLAPFITGAILANLLTQRGLMVLHGSAVVINGEGIAFLGEKGAGKSTLAVHLQTRGYSLITDDLIPIIFKKNEIQTMPGFPRIRLWSDSVESIGLNPQTLPQINSFIDKRSYKCFENFSNKPIKLSRLFILDNNDKMEIEQLNSQESFIEIVKNTYMNRYLQAIEQTVEHFHQCESIVKKVPVYKLKRPHDFNKLPQVAELIENFVKTP